MKGILLHGGSGTRLRPLTFSGPKQLIPVGNKPISQYVLEDLVESNVREIALVLGGLYSERVRDFYGDGSRFGAKITYVEQERPLGIAHAVGLCHGFVGDSPFIVYLGDNLLKGGIARYAKEFEDSRNDAAVLLTKVKNPERFGVALLDEHNRIVKLVEKPKEAPSNYALTGIYFFRFPIFKMIASLRPSWRNELEITEALQLLLSNKYRVGSQIVDGWWKDTGTVEDILESNRLVLDEISRRIQGAVDEEDSIQGRVQIARNAKIAQGAIVRGPSVIGDGTILESGVYVGPYTSIGNRVVIRRGEVENSVIMDNCVIDVPHRITDSIIGQGVTIVSGDHNSPKGLRLTLGENCQLSL